MSMCRKLRRYSSGHVSMYLKALVSHQDRQTQQADSMLDIMDKGL
jgi:hypothetical protein